MASSCSGVFTWMFIRLVNSDAYFVVHGLRYSITDSQVAIWILHGTISTVNCLHSSAFKRSSECFHSCFHNDVILYYSGLAHQ